jgi:hypothetical protein
MNFTNALKYEGRPCRRCGGTVRYVKNRHCINKGCNHLQLINLHHVRELVASSMDAETMVKQLRNMLLEK